MSITKTFVLKLAMLANHRKINEKDLVDLFFYVLSCFFDRDEYVIIYCNSICLKSQGKIAGKN